MGVTVVNDLANFETALHQAVVGARQKAEGDPSPAERFLREVNGIFTGFGVPDKDWYGLKSDEELVRWLKWRGKESLREFRFHCPKCRSTRCYLTIGATPAVTCYSCQEMFSTAEEVLARIQRMECEASERKEREQAEFDRAEDERVRRYCPDEDLHERMVNGSLKGLSDLEVFEVLLREALAPEGGATRPEDYDVPGEGLMHEVFPSLCIPEEDWRQLMGFDAVIRYLKKKGKPRGVRCPRCGALRCWLSFYSEQPLVCYGCFHKFPTCRLCEERMFDLGGRFI